MKVGSLDGIWVPEEERTDFAALSLCHVRTARRQPYKPGKQISSRTKPVSLLSHKSTPGWLRCSYDTAHHSLRSTQLTHRSRQLQKAPGERTSHVTYCLWCRGEKGRAESRTHTPGSRQATCDRSYFPVWANHSRFPLLQPNYSNHGSKGLTKSKCLRELGWILSRYTVNEGSLFPTSSPVSVVRCFVDICHFV